MCNRAVPWLLTVAAAPSASSQAALGQAARHSAVTPAAGARLSAASCGIISEPADNGLRTVLDIQLIGNTRYFDAGGSFFDRTLWLSQPSLVCARLFSRGSVCTI